MLNSQREHLLYDTKSVRRAPPEKGMSSISVFFYVAMKFFISKCLSEPFLSSYFKKMAEYFMKIPYINGILVLSYQRHTILLIYKGFIIFFQYSYTILFPLFFNHLELALASNTSYIRLSIHDFFVSYYFWYTNILLLIPHSFTTLRRCRPCSEYKTQTWKLPSICQPVRPTFVHLQLLEFKHWKSF